MSDNVVQLEQQTPADLVSRNLPYRGYRIVITNDFLFKIEGDEADTSPHTTFPSAKAARDEINRIVDLKAKAKATNYTKHVLNTDGSLITVTGFVRTEGTLKVVGAASVGRYVYPNVPWVANALKARAEAYKIVQTLDTQLQPFSIQAHHRAYRGMSAEDYAERLHKFDQEVDVSTQHALHEEGRQ